MGEDGVCNAGVCTYAAKEDGISCDDGFSYTNRDVCREGVCMGVTTTTTTTTTTATTTECPDWGVTYNGRCYAMMDKTPPNTPYGQGPTGTCQNQFIPMPVGWEAVPEDVQVGANVCSRAPWGTHICLFENG